MGSNGLMGILQDLMDIMEAFGRTDGHVLLDMRDIQLPADLSHVQIACQHEERLQ